MSRSYAAFSVWPPVAALLATLLAAPAAALDGSAAYRRAIRCSADAVVISNWLRTKTDGRRLVEGFRSDASRWLAVASSKGERSASQAVSDRSEIVSKIEQAYYLEPVGRRTAYLEQVAKRIEACQANPPR